jgi:hypothetical protein
MVRFEGLTSPSTERLVHQEVSLGPALAISDEIYIIIREKKTFRGILHCPEFG